MDITKFIRRYGVEPGDGVFDVVHQATHAQAGLTAHTQMPEPASPERVILESWGHQYRMSPEEIFTRITSFDLYDSIEPQPQWVTEDMSVIAIPFTLRWQLASSATSNAVMALFDTFVNRYGLHFTSRDWGGVLSHPRVEALGRKRQTTISVTHARNAVLECWAAHLNVPKSRLLQAICWTILAPDEAAPAQTLDAGPEHPTFTARMSPRLLQRITDTRRETGLPAHLIVDVALRQALQGDREELVASLRAPSQDSASTSWPGTVKVSRTLNPEIEHLCLLADVSKSRAIPALVERGMNEMADWGRVPRPVRLLVEIPPDLHQYLTEHYPHTPVSGIAGYLVALAREAAKNRS